MSQPARAELPRGRSTSVAELQRRADWIRLQTIELTEIAGSGHYASTFSCAEILAVLYYHTLRLRPGDPSWSDRDRFVLGKGHVAIGVYPCLATSEGCRSSGSVSTPGWAARW